MNNSNSQPGDWSCTKCGTNNFSRRTDCFKCQNPKNGSINSNQSLSGNPNLSSIGDEKKLIKLLGKAKSAVKTVEQNIQVYIKAWKHSRQLSYHELETLIVSLAKLPSSFVFENPPLACHCRVAVECYINFAQKNKEDVDFAQNVLPKIENIVHFVKVELPFSFSFHQLVFILTFLLLVFFLFL